MMMNKAHREWMLQADPMCLVQMLRTLGKSSTGKEYVAQYNERWLAYIPHAPKPDSGYQPTIAGYKSNLPTDADTIDSRSIVNLKNAAGTDQKMITGQIVREWALVNVENAYLLSTACLNAIKAANEIYYFGDDQLDPGSLARSLAAQHPNELIFEEDQP